MKRFLPIYFVLALLAGIAVLKGGERLLPVLDRDCAHFPTWQAAQRFYESSKPGDPHGLDRDEDGIACERLRR